MSIGRDPLSDYQRSLGESIENHRAQDLPSGGNSLFGRSVFGFLGQTFGGMIPRVPTVGGMSIGLGPDVGDQLKRQGVGLATNAIIGAVFGTGGPKFIREIVRKEKLEDKGWVEFHFDDDQEIDFRIPFFSNPRISESRDAKYVSNEIMNRNEPWRLWVGASPKKVSVDFSIQKPHIQSLTDGILEGAAKDFQFMLQGGALLESERLRTDELATQHTPNPWDVGVMGQGVSPAPAEPFKTDAELANKNFYDAMERSQVNDGLWTHVMNSVKVVQGSVVRSNDPNNINGPPIVRLKFGSLYSSSEKYILKSYTIKYDERWGYENHSNPKMSIVPRKIDISLKLESFSQGIKYDKDGIPSILNPPGWDTIMVIK